MALRRLLQLLPWVGRKRPPKVLTPVPTGVLNLGVLAKDVWLPYNMDFIETTGELVETVEVDPGVVEDELAQAEALTNPHQMPRAVAGAPAAVHAPPSLLVTAPHQPSLAVTPQPTGLARPQSSILIRELIMPNEAILRTQGVFEPTMALAKMVEQHGDCPSIVITAPERDAEYAELYSIRDTLARVTLRDHTLHVSHLALKILEETYRDHTLLIPKVLVAALGHDLGKIPIFRASGIYTMGDHPPVSAVKLQELFAGCEVVWFNEVLEAIKAHHRSSKEPLDVLLRDADGRARQMEVSQVTKEFTTKPWEAWCSVKELLALIAPRINVLLQGNKWSAVSIKDTVYVHPDLLLEAARRLAKEKKVIDLLLVRGSDRETVLRRLVDQLRAEGLVGPEIGDGFYGRYYQIAAMKSRTTKRGFFVSIKLEAFGVPASELEQRKLGFMELITELRPTR